MKLPGGCGEKLKKIAKLERAIYGLKQSWRKWGHSCADTLIADSFEQSKADPCIFGKSVDGVVVMTIAVYVDDSLVGRLRIVTVVSEQEISNERLRRVHLVRWVWCREERRDRYDHVVARNIRREFDDTL